MLLAETRKSKEGDKVLIPIINKINPKEGKS